MPRQPGDLSGGGWLSPAGADVWLRAVGGLALVVLVFATQWYGLAVPAHGLFGEAGATAAGAWRLLKILRWVLLLAAASALLSVVWPARGALLSAGVFGAVATVALFYRLLLNAPDPSAVVDVKFGGYLALIAVAALTLGAYAGLPRRLRGAAVWTDVAPAQPRSTSLPPQ